jgi:hypothetical protein
MARGLKKGRGASEGDKGIGEGQNILNIAEKRKE